MWRVLAAWLVGVNLLAFFTFGWDKRAARLGVRRVSEVHLLWLTFLLGAPGAWAGMRVFRHKTSKSSFRMRFLVVTLLEIAMIVGFCWLAFLHDPS